jgi:Flp pilus assembly protein CpaB
LLASPVRRGEPITDLRLLGPSFLMGAGTDEPNLVAVGVRIADAGVAALLRSGSVVDVLAAPLRDGFADGFGPPAGPGTAEVVASGVRVLAVPAGKRGSLEGALVLVAATEPQAARLAAAEAEGRLSIVLRPDSVNRP